MKVGDLVKFKNTLGVSGNVFLILRTGEEKEGQTKVWIYPSLNGGSPTGDINYHFAHYFEVLNESR